MSEDVAEAQPHIARFVESELVPRSSGWIKQRRVDLDSWRIAAEAGLFCSSIPEQYGGLGASLAYEIMIQQELSRAGLAGNIGICHSIHSIIVAHYILNYGTEAQKLRWLPLMANAEIRGAIAMTEPNAGSDLQGISTNAKRVGDQWQINGQKTFISNGQNANLILLVCRTSNGPGSESISLIAVETDNVSGFSRGRNLEKLGLHGQDTSELYFDDVLVPQENLLGEVPGRGFKQLMEQLALERLNLALNSVVSMERAFELALAYSRERRAFGQSIFDFQNTQFVLAQAKTDAVVARAFIDSLLVKLFDHELDAATAAMAKLWASETAFRQIDSCQQLFGGCGYMAEYPIAELAADNRVARVYGGTSEIMKLVIARSL